MMVGAQEVMGHIHSDHLIMCGRMMGIVHPQQAVNTELICVTSISLRHSLLLETCNE